MVALHCTYRYKDSDIAFEEIIDKLENYLEMFEE